MMIVTVALLGVLFLAISFFFNRQGSPKNADGKLRASGAKFSPLRDFLAEDFAEIKGRVMRVYATQCVGGAMVWHTKADASFHRSTDYGSKKLDTESWDAISKLLVKHLENLSRDSIGAYAPSHYIYIVAEFCQIRIEVYRFGENDSSYNRKNDLICQLIEATGGDEGMNWAPISDAPED